MSAAAEAAAGSIAALTERHGPRYRWLLMLSVMVGTMASLMSATVVNVAIPGMSHAFALNQERAQWVSSGFMVAMTISMLTTPWLLARYGYRRTYDGTMLLLAVGGIVGGLAVHFPVVMAARVAEGLAAGVVQPIPAIIMMRAFPPSEQGRASGMFGMGVVLAPALGPSIGGVLVDGFGWRSIFFMVVPFCAAAIWLAHRYVPVTAPGGVAADRGGARLDWRGLLLGGGGTLALLNGLLEIRGGGAAVASGLLVLGFALFGAMVLWLRHAERGGRPALLRLDVFAHRVYTVGSLVAFIYGIALYGSTYLLPVFMQLALQLPASHVGTILLPSGFVLAVTIGIAGRLTRRLPTHLMVSGGLFLLAASFALMATVGVHTGLWVLVVWAILGRIGLGFVLPSLNLGAMRPLDKGQIPQGASIINFVRMLGGAMGVSLCAIVLEWRLAAHGATLSGPTSPERMTAFGDAFLLLGAICAVAMAMAWQLRGPPQGDPIEE
ncbi:multidrug efflux MFS transporter [Ramlibacter sp. G-1-2-2]|uniref:Multidrug efflux MFS transporter n=1 Tax=Ramlibacter agri TaxID=2728837 RepID=A0A848GXK7_9BURK|nr:MFS transporter [Ramlibacter agri]NML42161.1 multidrug efflux MFS transporter [Ramlibacter agri]